LEINEHHQCGFRRNRSITDHIFCIRQILEKKHEYNEAVHRLVIEFKKAYDSVRREVLYIIPFDFGIPMKLERKLKNQNSIQEEIKSRLKSGNACYHSVQNLLSSSFVSKNLKNKIHRTIMFPVVLYGYETWWLALKKESMLTVFENRVLRRIFGPNRDEVEPTEFGVVSKFRCYAKFREVSTRGRTPFTYFLPRYRSGDWSGGFAKVTRVWEAYRGLMFTRRVVSGTLFLGFVW
jgi:hypothetical protein